MIKKDLNDTKYNYFASLHQPDQTVHRFYNLEYSHRNSARNTAKNNQCSAK